MIGYAIRYWRPIAAVAAAVGVAAASMQYRAGLIQSGHDECRAQVQRAINQQQSIANENALIYEAERASRDVEYRYRTREVVRHVPSDSDCDWSADAFSMLNSAITGNAISAGEPGSAMPEPANYRITGAGGYGSLDHDRREDVLGLR